MFAFDGVIDVGFVVEFVNAIVRGMGFVRRRYMVALRKDSPGR